MNPLMKLNKTKTEMQIEYKDIIKKKWKMEKYDNLASN